MINNYNYDLVKKEFPTLYESVEFNIANLLRKYNTKMYKCFTKYLATDKTNMHYKNKIDSFGSNYEIKRLDKELNKKIEKAALKRIKIKNMNLLNFQENVSDYKISNNENTNQNTNQTKSSSSNLIKLKNNNEFSINEKAEKEKIEEFKNLLQQIVSNIESQ